MDKSKYKYSVNNIEFEYLNNHPDHIGTKHLKKELRIPLEVTEWGYDYSSTDLEKHFTIKELLMSRNHNTSPLRWTNVKRTIELTQDALRQISDSVVEWFRKRGILSVYVTPHPQDISMSGEDLRPKGNKTLRFLIVTAPVGEVNTIAQGAPFDQENRNNLPAHKWIRKQSPLKAGSDDSKGDLLWRNQLHCYVNWLSRHPGRKVDYAIGSAGEGAVSLDYQITEQKPWTVYAQASNTGTENTSDIQERVGFVHNQLTGYDDILSLNYTTAGLGDDFNDVRASYDRPVTLGSRTRISVRGKYNEFTSTDIGVFDIDFTGEKWGGGATITHNFWQSGNWFMDLGVGFEAENISVANETFGTSGDESFARPLLSTSFEYNGQTASTNGSIQYKRNIADLAATEASEMSSLGRTGITEEDYSVITGNVSQTFFLEPIIYGQEWEDPSTPGSSTLAHEIQLSGRGQWSVLNRLISQETFIAGGMNTVRGYPESAASGDNGIMGSFEYRFHVPRILPVDPDPQKILGQEFKLSPKQAFDQPDWDFVLSAFVDAARTDNHDQPGVSEGPDNELLSTGAGAELIVLEHFRAQAYWGYALKDLENGEAEAGDDELHFLFQLSY